MPYTINRFNGTQVTVVADGTVDSTLDLKLIGKNYAGYGEIQNENFVFLLENFANTTAPPRPSAGQIWFDSGQNKLKFRDASNSLWRTTGGAEVSDSQPSGLTIGDFWYNTSTKQLLARDPTVTTGSYPGFVLIGPQGLGPDFGVTEMRSRVVYDNQTPTAGAHAIIEALVNGKTAYIISTDGEFVLKNDTANTIEGFSKIHKGLTLAYTNDDTVGKIGRTQTDHRWWGTASDSDRLEGLPASAFIQVDNVNFPQLVRFGDAGFTVGDEPNSDLKVYIVTTANGRIPRIKNDKGSRLEFGTTVSGGARTPLSLVGENIFPGTDNLTDIGSSTQRFKDVYAMTFNGLATKSLTLKVGSDDRTASTDAVPGSIVARTSVTEIAASGISITPGAVKGTFFVGTATSANYADLAEKYLADNEYEVGTVVMVGGEKEVTACQPGKRALGVVSANPAYMMNSELEGGTFIALKGRVPVKVYGMVKKGAELEAGSNGVAVVADPESTKVFAIALESNSDPDVKFVECIVL